MYYHHRDYHISCQIVWTSIALHRPWALLLWATSVDTVPPRQYLKPASVISLCPTLLLLLQICPSSQWSPTSSHDITKEQCLPLSYCANFIFLSMQLMLVWLSIKGRFKSTTGRQLRRAPSWSISSEKKIIIIQTGWPEVNLGVQKKALQWVLKCLKPALPCYLQHLYQKSQQPPGSF